MDTCSIPWRLVLAGTVAFTSCSQATSSVSPGTSVAPDHLLRHLIADADSVPQFSTDEWLEPTARDPWRLAIDPRPLRRRDEQPLKGESWETAWFAAVSSDELAARTATIQASGATSGEAPPLGKCPGVLNRTADHSSCPASRLVFAAFGRLVPRASIDTTARIVRVMWTDVDERGQRIEEYRYLVQWRGGRWWTLDRRRINGIYGR